MCFLGCHSSFLSEYVLDFQPLNGPGYIKCNRFWWDCSQCSPQYPLQDWESVYNVLCDWRWISLQVLYFIRTIQTFSTCLHRNESLSVVETYVLSEDWNFFRWTEIIGVTIVRHLVTRICSKIRPPGHFRVYRIRETVAPPHDIQKFSGPQDRSFIGERGPDLIWSVQSEYRPGTPWMSWRTINTPNIKFGV